MRIRNGIDPSPYREFLPDLIAFRDRLVNDTCVTRIYRDFQRANDANRIIEVPLFSRLAHINRLLIEAPSNLLDFNQEEAQALWYLLNCGHSLRALQNVTTFLEGIVPSVECYQAWNQLLTTGYFSN